MNCLVATKCSFRQFEKVLLFVTQFIILKIITQTTSIVLLTHLVVSTSQGFEMHFNEFAICSQTTRPKNLLIFSINGVLCSRLSKSTWHGQFVFSVTSMFILMHHSCLLVLMHEKFSLHSNHLCSRLSQCLCVHHDASNAFWHRNSLTSC